MQEQICTTEADFSAAASNLKTQGFNMIAPNFDLLKVIGSSIELPIKQKVILSGKTNERGWQICLLDFAKGRLSVVNPSDYPIGSVCKITYVGDIERKGKQVKDFTVALIQTNQTAKPATAKKEK